MQFNWYPTNIFIGIVLCLYFAFIFWTKQTGNIKANRCLALFALTSAFMLFDAFLFASAISLQFPQLFGLLFPLVFFVGPLIRLYADSIIDPDINIDPAQLVHFSPVLIATVALLPFLLLPADQKHSVITTTDYSNLSGKINLAIYVIFIGAVMHNGYYVITTIERVVNFNRKTFAQNKSDRNKRMAMLNYVMIAIFCIVLVLALDVGLDSQVVGERMLLLSQTQMILDVFVFGCLLNWQSRVATMRQTEAVKEAAETPILEGTPATKYEFSALSSEQGKYYQEQLLTLMQSEKLYRNGELSLPELSEQLGISSNYLSQIINEQLGVGFRDFLNQYRVDEVQNRLRKDPESTILDVALDAGFNSKSAFYDAFKKQVGMTPSQFRKSIEAA